MKTSQKKLLFVLLFAVVGFILLQIRVPNLAGTNVTFTLFDFFGPIAGAFLGGVLGIVSVFVVTFTNFLLKGVIEIGPIIRLFPTLFAVYYFSLPAKKRNSRKILAVPLLAMLIFWAHPEGRAAWYFALFWLIPVIAFFKRDNIYLRSLGSTFTAHAIGGAAWAWTFNLPATVWKGLIPVVAMERFLFAGGIAVSYVVMTTVLAYLTEKKILPAGLRFESAYRLSPLHKN